MVQEQYWKEIYQLKTHIGFIELQLERSEKIDRILKMTLAIVSSTSIGAWAIWNKFSWLWGSIIAISQVISAIQQFLPYRSRIKTYSPLLYELDILMIHAESKWHKIAEGEMTAEQINKARFSIREKKQNILKKYILTTIPFNEKLHAKAEASAREYLNNFYSS